MRKNEEMTDGTPTRHTVRSKFQGALKLYHALGELIDNAVYEKKGGATRVEISFERDHVMVLDNGHGLSNIIALQKDGFSTSQDDPADPGYYGIGAKEALFSLGTVHEVHSIHNGRYYRYRQNWRAWVEDDPSSSDWTLPAVEELPVYQAPYQLRDQGCGLLLIAKEPYLEKRLVSSKDDLERLADRLSEIYAPLKRKREVEIVLRRGRVRREVHRESLPQLDNVVQGRVHTAHGIADYVAGFLTEGRKRSGIEIDFLDCRRICRKSYLNGSGRVPDAVYLHLRLGEGWKVHLSKNKNELVSGEHELAKALLSEREIKALFELGEDDSISGYFRDLQGMFQSVFDQPSTSHPEGDISVTTARPSVSASNDGSSDRKMRTTAVVTGRRARQGKQKTVIQHLKIERRSLSEPHFASANVSPEMKTVVVTLNKNHELYSEIVQKAVTAQYGRQAKRNNLIMTIANEVAKAAAQRGPDVIVDLLELLGLTGDEEDTNLVFELATAIYLRAVGSCSQQEKAA
ncbi:MAG: ATP-binding protein [Myxococcales bacterium]|nr:ATP-binding protein [Myxococcales bacterium]